MTNGAYLSFLYQLYSFRRRLWTLSNFQNPLLPLLQGTLLPAIRFIPPGQVSDHSLAPFERKITSISFDIPSSVTYLPLATAQPPSPAEPFGSPTLQTHMPVARSFWSAVVETPDTLPVLWATSNILEQCAVIHCTYGFCDGNAWTKTDEYRGRFRNCRHPSRAVHAFQFNLLTLFGIWRRSSHQSHCSQHVEIS